MVRNGSKFGVGISILPEKVVNTCLSQIQIYPSQLNLRTYNVSIIKPMEEIRVKIKFCKKEHVGRWLFNMVTEHLWVNNLCLS